jgi:hypothetical protein
MQYKICRDCGAHIDFGESCDCKKEAATDDAVTTPKKNDDIHMVASSAVDVKGAYHA